MEVAVWYNGKHQQQKGVVFVLCKSNLEDSAAYDLNVDTVLLEKTAG